MLTRLEFSLIFFFLTIGLANSSELVTNVDNRSARSLNGKWNISIGQFYGKMKLLF